jgi:hypothetical protein
MGYGLLADVIALVHILFVLFVMFGALFALRWPRAIWVHAPALIWGFIVEFGNLVCPLTPLETRLRVLSGEAGYRESFLSHWLMTVLYPDFLTRDLQVVLGGSLLLLNIGLYAYVWRKKLARRSTKNSLYGDPAGPH